MRRLAALGSEKMRAFNRKRGVEGDQYGVQLGAIRKLAAELRGDHASALALWESGNFDARLLAILLLQPKALSATELDAMVRDSAPAQVADWFAANILKQHPDREALRLRWMADADPWAARAGWGLTADRIAGSPEGLDLRALLDRIEAEMGSAAPATQWTMNFCLAAIGINIAAHRKRAIAIGEALGVYRDYPVSKGCTSPFAPVWIAEMVSRQRSTKGKA